mmetsp:Transcript_2230/g.8652  ORF Transcript_2230/g.8652 Transcript_2230/m.8652 type:complete len:317 (-) Transcript_2230:132-1082(-)
MLSIRRPSMNRTSLQPSYAPAIVRHASAKFTRWNLVTSPASTSLAFRITAILAMISQQSFQNCTDMRNNAATMSTSCSWMSARRNVPPRLRICAAAPATQMSATQGRRSRTDIRTVSLITSRALNLSPTMTGAAIGGGTNGAIFGGFSSTISAPSAGASAALSEGRSGVASDEAARTTRDLILRRAHRPPGDREPARHEVGDVDLGVGLRRHGHLARRERRHRHQRVRREQIQTARRVRRRLWRRVPAQLPVRRGGCAVRCGARALVARDERSILPGRRLGGVRRREGSSGFPVAVQGEGAGDAQDGAGAVGGCGG